VIELPYDCGPIRRSDENNEAVYWRYIMERQAIWHRRFVLKLPRPWTNDPILDTYSFTNAYRELDRGTIHYRQQCWPLIEKMTPEDQLWWTAVYRFFNRPETWDNVLASYTPYEMHDERILRMGAAIRDYGKKSGLPVWTGSYMVCAYATSPGFDKIERVMNFLIKLRLNLSHLVQVAQDCESTEYFHAELEKMDGIGAFGAYEILSDLLMMRWKPLAGFDANEWANPGPGAKKGLQFVFDDEGYTFSRPEMQKLMRHLEQTQDLAWAELDLPFYEVALPDAMGRPTPLSMRNIEHNLCEVFKYQRGSCRGKFVERTKA
jgi:hypothetical protein